MGVTLYKLPSAFSKSGHGHGQLHDEAHNVASHSDTDGTGSELNELTDGSQTTLHSHASGGGTHPVDLATDVTGTLDKANIDGDIARDSELHAVESGESGTHNHGNLYYTETEHGGVSPQGHHTAQQGHHSVESGESATHTHGNLYYTEGEVNSLLHAEIHAPETHSDTDITGAELQALSGGGEIALHSHAGGGGYTDSDAIAAVPFIQYIPFGSEPITGQSYAP